VRFLLALLLASACALPARAQEGPALELEVSARDARRIDREALREAIGRELGIEVGIATRRRSEVPRVRVRLVARDRAALELVRGDGSRMRRSTELPADPAERLETVVILAVNMVRDEASELLELLRSRRAQVGAPPEETPSETPAPTPVETPAQTPVETPAEPTRDPALIASADPAARITSDPAPDEAPAEVEPERPADTVPSPPSQRVFRFGIGGLIGSVPRGTGLEATFVGGLELAWTPTDFLAFGLRDVAGGAPLGSNGIWSAGGAVFGELGWIVDPALVLHLELGLDVRAHVVGADLRSGGLAPFVLLGARWFPIRELSLAIQSALHVAATDSWSTNLHLLPVGAVLWTGGITIAAHVS
jgi:hypothetical protein